MCGFKAEIEPIPKHELEFLQERIVANLVLWSSAADLPPYLLSAMKQQSGQKN